MKTLILSSALALGLIFTGSVQADTLAYNSKTTQNISSAPATGGAFDGTYLSSKAGSRLVGPSQEQVAARADVGTSAVAINTAYNSKTMQKVGFGRSEVVSSSTEAESNSAIAMR